MQLNSDSFEELIGAYALDACDDDELAAVEAYVAEHPDAAAEVERLRAAAAWLGASGPLIPPPNLRTSIMDRLAPAVTPASGVDAYTEIAAALADELDDPAAPLDAITTNGLSVRDLVAHLTAIDTVFLDELTAPSGRAFPNAAEVVPITDEFLATSASASPSDVFRTWRATSGKLRDVAAAAPGQTVMGYSANDALVIRSFETWTHLDDIRRAGARPRYVPDASTLRSMADLSMRLMPYALAATGRTHPGESITVVLTGPGGRSYDVALAPGEDAAVAPATVMTADIVEWCYRFAERVEADAFARDVVGDDALVADLVAAAPAFASL
jgi:uncharacterized protein (TIGR03083 family)